MTDPAKTLKIICNFYEEDLVTGIQEYNITTSESEDKLPVNVIHDEGESFKPDENLKSSAFTYHNKDNNTHMSAYDRVFNSLKQLYNSYNTTIPSIHKPVTNGKFNVTKDTRFIPILVEDDEYGIQWAFSTPISKDAG